MFLVLSRCSSITRYPNLHQLSIIAHCRTKSESRVLAIVQGARRFILYNKWVIENCPLQVYASALVFGPANSLIRRSFEDEKPKWITILSNVESDWGPCLQTLEGHSHSVRSVAFSPDGKLVASASADD